MAASFPKEFQDRYNPFIADKIISKHDAAYPNHPHSSQKLGSMNGLIKLAPVLTIAKSLEHLAMVLKPTDGASFRYRELSMLDLRSNNLKNIVTFPNGTLLWNSQFVTP